MDTKLHHTSSRKGWQRKVIALMSALLLASLPTHADNFTLKGKIVDEEENALELVSVSCLAQGKVTMTNLKGEFSIDLQSADSVEVRFSMVGYGTRKIGRASCRERV